MAVKHYGTPYKGSKNSIAEWVVSHFPAADNVYDLFCGGCAITHRLLLQGRYKNYYANDIDPSGLELFINSIHGKYTLQKCRKWISREDFKRYKDTDPFIKYVWSFGNNGRDYIYGEEIEPYKKALHYAIFFNDYSLSKELGFDLSAIDSIKTMREKYLLAKQIIKGTLGKKEFCQSLENLNRLQSLQSLQSLHISSLSYDKVKIDRNSVIYCDIPYFETNAYGKKNTQTFDHDAFYKWAQEQTETVIISEYYCPSDFVSIAEIEKRSLLCASDNTQVKTERLYIPSRQVGMYKALINRGYLIEV